MDYDQIQRGWTVYDATSNKIGEITDLGPNYLLVEKGMIFVKDVYVPMTAISDTDVANQCVYVNVSKDAIDSQGWDSPPAESFAQTSQDATGSTDLSSSGVSASGSTAFGSAGTEDQQRMRLHEEELQAQTRREQAGEVQVNKRVVTDNRELDVPVTHDEVEVRRVSVDRDATAGDAAFTDDGDTIRVPVTAESVEVTKQPRVVEEIEIAKRPVTETQTVRETVRREEADIQQQGDVTVAGGSARDLVGSGADRMERTDIDEIEKGSGNSGF